MNLKHLGCLSPSALLSAFITLIVISVVEILSGNSMFSPGPLNAQPGVELGSVTSHASTGKNCAACHPAPWTQVKMSDLCITCHEAIRIDIGDPTTLHGALFTQEGLLTCRNCHPEHRGAAASLTVVEDLTFPHEVVGFALTGHARQTNGAAFTCANCHTESITFFTQQVCKDCHLEIDAEFTTAHSEYFGDNCLACHDGADRYGQFDHNQTAFVLEGAHLEAACSGCHQNPQSPADLANTPAACEDCHLSDDPHNGEFGSVCGACHSPEGWKPANFNHNLTDFPLDGAHLQLACADCHSSDTFKGISTACAACHSEPEFHPGLFTGQACSNCHTTSAWRPASYDGPHSFPMNHGRENNVCADCHQPNLAQWSCYSCHERAEMAEEHQKEGITDLSNCLECHPNGQKVEGGRE